MVTAANGSNTLGAAQVAPDTADYLQRHARIAHRFRIRRTIDMVTAWRALAAVLIVGAGVSVGASPAVAASIVVSSVSPPVVRTGATTATIDIYGSGFNPEVWVEIRRPNAPLGEHAVGAGAARVHSGSHLTVDIGFSNFSPRDRYSVSVKDGNGNTGSCDRCLTLYRAGYWMVGEDGSVYAFGDAPFKGSAREAMAERYRRGVRAVSVVPMADMGGYCVVDDGGGTYCFNAGPGLGPLPAGTLRPGEKVTSLALRPPVESDRCSTPPPCFDRGGYWFFTNLGRVLPQGGAPSYGDMSGTKLNGPVLGAIPTPSGRGYYMVASDGGVFTFGDAAFFGSMGAQRLNGPVKALAPTNTNRGYWLVATDGGIFSFGDAGFHGSMGGEHLNRPVVGMVPYGVGYLMVASDGGIFNFSGRPFDGSLGDNPPANDIASTAVMTP